MDFELWWLLPIPALFFGLGWIAARIDIKHLLRESRALPLSYFRGLNFLLNEQEKDWPKAITVTRRMEALAKRPYFKEIAHYFCEQAQNSLLRSQFMEAREHIEHALAEYKLCTRATILLGDVEAQEGNYPA